MQTKLGLETRSVKGGKCYNIACMNNKNIHSVLKLDCSNMENIIQPFILYDLEKTTMRVRKDHVLWSVEKMAKNTEKVKNGMRVEEEECL